MLEVGAMGLAVGAVLGLLISYGVNRWRRWCEPLPDTSVVSIGGRLFKKNDLTPELITEFKKEYLMPPATNEQLIRVNFSATCYESHNTMVKTGVFTRDAVLLGTLVSALQKSKATVTCGTCGKKATIAGKQIAWAGPMKLWDGV